MRIKVAVIGASSMGMNHLRVLRDFNEEQVELVGVAELYEPILQRAISRFHIAGFTDYRQMVEQTHPHLVAVVVAAAIRAANTQPFSHILSPGVGVGGHCIPVYQYFLLAGVEKLDPFTSTPELSMLTLPRSARRINDAMAEYAMQRIEAVIGSLAHRSVLILGVAYRGDVYESAFTSTKRLQDTLLEHGATVYVDDPLFSDDELLAPGYRPYISDRSDEICAIILQAGHQVYQEFEFSRYTKCQVVLDGRRALCREQCERIKSLGMDYIAIGDGYHKTLKTGELSNMLSLQFVSEGVK